jgi:hypothetical protein
MDSGRDRPTEASPGLSEVIGRALTDERFRETLFQNRESAVRDYQLTDTDMTALDSLSREQLEQHAEAFRDSSVAGIAISIVIRVKF